MNITKILIVVVGFSLSSAAIGQWGRPSKSQVQEYIEIFVNVGLYAVPHSEPLSVLLSSPDILQLGLHSWVRVRLIEADDDYQDALDRGVRGRSLENLARSADKYQAILSCISQNDCTRLRQFEGKEKPELDISGTWHSRHGYVYDIYQTDRGFRWTVVKPIRETATLTMLKNGQFEATWTNSSGTDSATGEITETDARGRATKIEWSNRAIFFRK